MNEQKFSNEIETAAGVLRNAARRFGQSAAEYGTVLQNFGEGNASATEVLGTALNLGAQSARALLDDGITLGTAYYRWVFAALGVRHVEPATPAQATPAEEKAAGQKDRGVPASKA